MIVDFSDIEWIALIFAVVTLAKVITVAISPAAWMRLTDPLFKNPKKTRWIYLFLGLLIGWIVLEDISIVELAASISVAALLMGFGILSFPAAVERMRGEFLAGNYSKKSLWPVMLIWGVFALYVIFAVLYINIQQYCCTPRPA